MELLKSHNTTDNIPEMNFNYYSTLEINKNAYPIDIKRAYKKQTLTYNPQSNDDGKKFRKITFAFYILSNPTYRKIYDADGHVGLLNNEINMDNINFLEIYEKEITANVATTHVNGNIVFDNNISITENITLGDVYTGKYVDKTVMRKSLCQTCKGIGSDDGILRVCKKCQGRRTHVSYSAGVSNVSMCEYCDGTGINSIVHKCKECNGLRTQNDDVTFRFMIPIGAEDNDIICVKKIGNINIGNDYRDDINIKILILNDPTFKRNYPGIALNREDLAFVLHVPLVNALCGISRVIQLPNGEKCKFNVNTCSKQNDIHVIDNVGLPKKNQTRFRGKLYVIVDIEYPEKISESASRAIFGLLKNYDRNDVADKTS
jgi:DnaJ-class molecular chaperone